MSFLVINKNDIIIWSRKITFGNCGLGTSSLFVIPYFILVQC